MGEWDSLFVSLLLVSHADRNFTRKNIDKGLGIHCPARMMILSAPPCSQPQILITHISPQALIGFQFLNPLYWIQYSWLLPTCFLWKRLHHAIAARAKIRMTGGGNQTSCNRIHHMSAHQILNLDIAHHIKLIPIRPLPLSKNFLNDRRIQTDTRICTIILGSLTFRSLHMKIVIGHHSRSHLHRNPHTRTAVGSVLPLYHQFRVFSQRSYHLHPSARCAECHSLAGIRTGNEVVNPMRDIPILAAW
jgi:hypothetical protein